jgi:hypothetical protein
MLQFFNQFLEFIRQGIGAIFRFIQFVWLWVARQIGDLASVPWHDWPLWKILLAVAIAIFVGRQLYNALWEIWQASEKILAALATLMGVLIKTLPQVVIAGLLALAGVWVLNNLDFSGLRRPSFMQTGSWGSEPPSPPCAPTRRRGPGGGPCE